MVKIFRKIGRLLIVPLLIISWIFSGWPPIWQNPVFPPKIQETKAAVIAQYSGGLLVYADTVTVGTPKYKTFDDTTGFGTEQSAQSVGSNAINWIRVAASPTDDEWIIVTRDSGNVIKAQVCTGVDGGVSCGTPTQITATAGTHGFRNFDVAYEQSSGDALLVYGTATTDELRKIEWTGGSWTGDAAITTTRTSGVVEWVELTSRPGSDQIGIAYSDTADAISAYRWNGSSVTDEATANIGSTAITADFRKFDVSFEGTSGDMLVVAWVGAAGTARTAQLVGTTWTIGDQTGVDVVTGFVDLPEVPTGTNYIGISSHGAAATTLSEGFAWSGTAVVDGTAGDDNLLTWAANYQLTAIAYLNSTYPAVAVISNSAATDDIDWWTMNSSGTITDQTVNTRTRGAGSFRDLFDYPNADKVLLLTADANSDLWADTWNGTTPGGTVWTDLTSGGALETDLATATKDVVDFAFRLAPIVTDATVSVSGTQTTGLVIPSTNNYVGGKFAIAETGASSRNVTGMTIAEQGTVDAQTNLDNIKLYYESDTSAPYDCASETYAGTESQFGSTDTDGFSASNGTSAFTGSVGITTASTMCVYVVLDVGSGATNGQTMEIEITNPSTDVTTSAGTVGPATALAISGTTTLQPPGVVGSLGKSADGWAGAVPVYMTLVGIASSSYPYARAQVTTISSQVFYADMTWDAGDNRYEGVVYPGSNICMGCDDPKTYNGSFSVVVQLDNNADFSSVDYSGSAVTFTTAITLKRSSMDNVTATNYTDFNAVWSTDHWNISIDDFGFSMNTGSGSNIAVAVPIHPITSSPSNFAVSFNGSSVSQGSAQSTTNAWWWESDSHTLYLQFASLTTTLVDVDIDFQSDTDLFATRYNWTYTADMGSRKGSNGLYIANHYLTTFYYAKPFNTTDNNVACSGNECEMTGMQAESRAHEDGGPDESTDCMERVAVHVDDTARSDATTYYQYDIKWKPSETPDWIISENNNQMVLVANSDNTASTGWAQQLNNGISAQRTQTFYANKRYIKNVYDFTNNDSVAHKYPMIWEREQWHGTDRATNDAGRFQGDTSDRIVEERIPLTGFSCPWQTAYDTGTFINMGIVYSSADLPDYGIFAVEPFLAPTTAEWPIVITEDHGTNTADQTGFEKTWSSVAASETVSFTFWHVHNAESSWANISTAMDADCAEVNNPSFTQSAFRWFSNANSTQIGSTLTATQNASTTLANSGDAFRLRMLMHVDSADVTAGSQDFKLQVATSTTGGCDAEFVGESYADVSTASGYIRFNNNASPADGDLLTASSTDPTHSSDTIVNQTYEEANNFTVTSTIAVGNDGKWDFSLKDVSAPGDTTFCFRMVKSDGTELDTYSVIPEIKTAPSTGSLSVDIVDSGGSSVASPQVDMDTSSLGFSCQSTAGFFGTSSERIRVENNTGGANWTLTIAATATTSVWSAGSLYFDSNDSNGSPNGCTDGGDTDSYAGQMSINPSAGVLTPEGGCSSTGISKGNSSAFNQGTVDNITLLSASSADTGCYWDFVDVDIAQQIPAEQSSGSYTIDLVVTVTAS